MQGSMMKEKMDVVAQKMDDANRNESAKIRNIR
jgi:hypothetical protein